MNPAWVLTIPLFAALLAAGIVLIVEAADKIRRYGIRYRIQQRTDST